MFQNLSRKKATLYATVIYRLMIVPFVALIGCLTIASDLILTKRVFIAFVVIDPCTALSVWLIAKYFCKSQHLTRNQSGNNK